MNDFTDLNILGFFFLTWSLTFITAVKYPLNYIFGGLYIILGLFFIFFNPKSETIKSKLKGRKKKTIA